MIGKIPDGFPGICILLKKNVTRQPGNWNVFLWEIVWIAMVFLFRMGSMVRIAMVFLVPWPSF